MAASRAAFTVLFFLKKNVNDNSKDFVDKDLYLVEVQLIAGIANLFSWAIKLKVSFFFL